MLHIISTDNAQMQTFVPVIFHDKASAHTTLNVYPENTATMRTHHELLFSSTIKSAPSSYLLSQNLIPISEMKLIVVVFRA